MQEDRAGWGSPQVAHTVKQQIKECTTNFFTLILLKGKTAVDWPNPTTNPQCLTPNIHQTRAFRDTGAKAELGHDI